MQPNQPEYEFRPHEAEVIRGLSRSMKFVGIVSITIGALMGIAGVANGSEGVAATVQGAIMLLVGAWLTGSATSFRRVADTAGNDVTHLMNALRKLRQLFTFQAYLYGIASLLFVIGIVSIIAQQKH